MSYCTSRLATWKIVGEARAALVSILHQQRQALLLDIAQRDLGAPVGRRHGREVERLKIGRDLVDTQ